MDARHARYLAAVRAAMPYAIPGAAEVRTSSTVERTVIDVLSESGALIATTTIYTRALAPAQLALQMGEAPAPRSDAAPAASPLPSALVEITVMSDGWEPTHADERVDDTTVIAWTSTETDHWRTVVSTELAPWVRARLSRVPFVEAPAHRCSHVVRVGDVVATRTYGSLRVVGVVRDPSEHSTGLALDLSAREAVVAAWLDSAMDPDMGAELLYSVSTSTRIVQVDGAWMVDRGEVRAAKPAKSPRTKAGAA